MLREAPQLLYPENGIKTFEDVMNAIEETKKNHLVRVQHTGRGLGSKGFYYVLTNATILQTKLILWHRFVPPP